MVQRLPFDTTPRGLQRLYYRIVFYGVAAVLLLEVVTGFAVGTGFQLLPLEVALYGTILLLSWFAFEVNGDAKEDRREPRGILLGFTGILLVLLCIETGGLASGFYMLVFLTCIFGALVMRPVKAFLLVSVIAAVYCLTSWMCPSEGSLLHGDFRLVIARVTEVSFEDARNVSGLVVHCGFLYAGTWIAMRLSSGFREKVVHLEGRASRDPLTGLPNRRGFMEKLSLQMARAIHWDWPVAILMIDLDLFKKVNDRFGHPVGDQVLAATAQLLRETAGPLDNLARIGGEEFAVAAVGADKSHAADLADRIVRGFRAHDWQAVRAGLEITCSVGVATMQPSRETRPLVDLPSLIDEADRALLKVKSRGRNGYLLSGDALRPPSAHAPHCLNAVR